MVEEKAADTRNLWQRMLAVQEEVGYIQKDKRTQAQGAYRYVSHDAVVAKIRPALIKHGVLAIQSVVSSEHNEIVSQDGNGKEKITSVCWCTVKTTFVNEDNPAETYEVLSIGQGIDPQDKSPGKAQSYACKYGLLKGTLTETGDDPEQDGIDMPHNGSAKAPAAPQKSKSDDTLAGGEAERKELFAQISAIAAELGISKQGLSDWCKARYGKASATEFDTVTLRLLPACIRDHWKTPPEGREASDA